MSNIDIRGITRGACECGCLGYLSPEDGLYCKYCNCVPMDHETLNESSTSAEKIGNQPKVDSSDAPIQKQVSHRPESSGVRKRQAPDPDGNEESMQKKQKQPKPDKGSIENITMEPCKLLHLSHIHYTEIPPSRVGNHVKGVFKIAYNWKTIYVGTTRDCVFKQLRRQFRNTGNSDLFEFLKTLDTKERQNVSIFWLDDSKYTHNCDEKSYQECIGKLQGEKPRFNTRSASEKMKAETSSSSLDHATSRKVANTKNTKEKTKDTKEKTKDTKEKTGNKGQQSLNDCLSRMEGSSTGQQSRGQQPSSSKSKDANYKGSP